MAEYFEGRWLVEQFELLNQRLAALEIRQTFYGDTLMAIGDDILAKMAALKADIQKVLAAPATAINSEQAALISAGIDDMRALFASQPPAIPPIDDNP